MANPLTNRKFIHFNNLANFENIIENQPGAILDSQIVFIKDARKIWTHGTYYTLDERITNDIYARLQELAEISADIIQRLEVPVLSAAPTTSTSTYDTGANTFVVDQSCKVADANGYYTYYRLHSIVSNTYNWKKEENLSSEQILNIVKYGTDKEVVEANGVSQFPATGEAGVVYIDTSTTPSTPYKWQNGAYVQDSTLIDNSDKQANWAETDSNSNQYIQNKPTIITDQAILDLFGGSSVDPSQNPNVITSNDVVNTTSNGVVPKTTAAAKYLQTNSQGVASWGDLPTTPDATTGASGLMSATDKTKLNGIAEGATANVGTVTGITIGTGGTDYTPTNGIVTIPEYPTTLPASDVSAWAKAANKPSYGYGEIAYLSATSADYTIANSSTTLSVDGTQPLQVVTTTANIAGITFSALPANGHSCHLIITATSAKTVDIAHNATMITVGGTAYTTVCPKAAAIDTLEITAGGYVELDLLRVGTKIYVRGV